MKLPNALDFVKKMQMDIREAPFESAEQAQAQNIISEVWCEQIIEALEKQIPEKLNQPPYQTNCFTWICPRCKMVKHIRKSSFCDECGQAIGWSEVSE